MAWLRAYTAVWGATLGFAALVGRAGPPATLATRHVLGLRLTPNPFPRLEDVLALAAHNIPILSWPLLLGVLGADRWRPARRGADCLLLASIAANTLPVGAALGAYGARLLPYVPQLPLEWAALALGAASWTLQRSRPLSPRERLATLALIVLLLLAAATVETTAIPHTHRSCVSLCPN